MQECTVKEQQHEELVSKLFTKPLPIPFCATCGKCHERRSNWCTDACRKRHKQLGPALMQFRTRERAYKTLVLNGHIEEKERFWWTSSSIRVVVTDSQGVPVQDTKLPSK